MTSGLDRFPIIGAVKRRIAATAASAAIAVASPAVAADRSVQRSGKKPDGKPQVTRVAGAESHAARQALEVLRRDEMNLHRHRLAQALAAELPSTNANGIAQALAIAGGDPSVTLASSTGRSEAEIDEAFEAMARHAREARLKA